MNKLCQLCLKDCKQADTVMIIECRKYCRAPVQIEFKFKGRSKAQGSRSRKK